MVKYLTLEDISSYKMSYELSNNVWDIVLQWGYFEKKTIGDQLVRSADSISANIAEGFGRYSKKDKVKFYRYSLGSLHEVHDWLNKSKYRKLVNVDQYQLINDTLVQLRAEIYNLINFTNEKLKF